MTSLLAIHLWLLDPATLSDPAVRTRAFAMLAPLEVERARRFAVEADRDGFLAARMLARIAPLDVADRCFTPPEIEALCMTPPEIARSISVGTAGSNARSSSA